MVPPPIDASYMEYVPICEYERIREENIQERNEEYFGIFGEPLDESRGQFSRLTKETFVIYFGICTLSYVTYIVILLYQRFIRKYIALLFCCDILFYHFIVIYFSIVLF